MENEKKLINVLTIFSIFHKNGIKTFLKWIVNHCLKGTRQHNPNYKYSSNNVNYQNTTAIHIIKEKQ